MNREHADALIRRASESAGFGEAMTRRGFLFFSACAVSSVTALGLCEAFASSPPIVILDNAKGMLLADPSRCVGCQRCELACVEFNEGRSQPSMSRIKISRALNFGPAGPTGGPGMRGAWGDGLVVQGVCRQCPHPVPCATACPQDAIRLDKATGARIVERGLCVGCKLCQQACPYSMMVFDEAAQKSSKCFLCDGKPKCVEACPADALRYVPWRDLTREGAPKNAGLALITPAKAKACLECHGAPASSATR